MRTPRALCTLAALSLLACATPSPPPGAGAGGDVCEVYRDRPDVHAFCVRRSVSQLDEAAAVARCDTLGAPAAGACRHAWVLDALARPDRPPRETLLAACGEQADCAFEVLDRMPADVVTVQLDDCRLHAAPYVGDCVSHALQGWYLKKPDAAGVAAMEAAAAPWPTALGTAIGNLRWCEGVRAPPEGTSPEGVDLGCPAEPVAASACLRALQDGVSRPIPCEGTQHDLPPLPPPGGGPAGQPHTFPTNP